MMMMRHGNENENNKQRMKHETLKTMMMMNGQSSMVACEVVMLLQCGKIEVKRHAITR